MRISNTAKVALVVGILPEIVVAMSVPTATAKVRAYPIHHFMNDL
jgi:hypothetical protein